MTFVQAMLGTAEMKPLPVDYGISLRVPHMTFLTSDGLVAMILARPAERTRTEAPIETSR